MAAPTGGLTGPSLGRVGVFSVPLEVLPRSAAAELVGELEELGFGAIWTGEGLGTREIFVNAAVILAATRQIPFCAGIANIWARDPVAAVTATRTLLESFPDRFSARPRSESPGAAWPSRTHVRAAGRHDARVPRRDGRGAVREPPAVGKRRDRFRFLASSLHSGRRCYDSRASEQTGPIRT